MKAADLEQLARRCEHAPGGDPRLGRDVLVATAGWRVDGRELYSLNGWRARGDDPTPHTEDDPTISIDACRRICRAPLLAASAGERRAIVKLDGGEGGDAGVC